jgi:hypothetical protein
MAAASQPVRALAGGRTPTTTRIERLAPWIAGLALACPVLVAYYPPMTDLAFHEGAIGVLRHFGDATLFPPGLYVRNLGEPNQLFHMLGWALSYVVSTRWAVKLVVAGAVVAIPVTAGRLARHVGSSPVAALLVAPMALGWLFSWGLVANLLGLAALLGTLPALDRLGATPTLRRAGHALGATLLLYFAHMAMMFVYSGASLGLALLYRPSWRGSALRLSPLVAGIAITLGQARLQRRFLTPAQVTLPIMWHPFVHKVERIPYIVLPAAETSVTLGMLVLCVSAIAAFLWLRTRERRAPEASPPIEGDTPSSLAAEGRAPSASTRIDRARAWGLAHRWDLFAAAGFAAYLIFPLTLRGATLVYQRWFPPAFAVLAATSTPRNVWIRAARVPLLAAFALPLATLMVSWPSFADSDREYRMYETILSAIEPGSAIAILELGPGDPTRTFSLGPAGGRVLATHGGRLAYSFTDSAISPVCIPRKHQWQEVLLRLGFDPWGFRPDHDLKMFRYVVARTNDGNIAQAVAFALLGRAKLLRTSGEWLLFESKQPTVPLLSRPLPMDDPPPEQLRDLVATLLGQTRDAPAIPPETAPDPAAPHGQSF